MLEAVRRYALLQLNLINNVLDYSRIASGKMSYHVERFALAPLLDEILTMHRGRHGDRALLLAASVDPDVPELETDRIKLHEIVRNLVDNAVKFTASGSVLVRARPGVRPAHVLIEVIDTGPGIRPDDLRHVFEAFQQTGPAGARHGGGVGLGLSIVKQLTEALGGHVSVASRPGEGSTFRVEIPGVLAPVSAPGDGAGAATAALEAVARNAAAAITERAAMSGAAGATRS
jgi:signal transduction histidine kinase